MDCKRGVNTKLVTNFSISLFRLQNTSTTRKRGEPHRLASPHLKCSILVTYSSPQPPGSPPAPTGSPAPPLASLRAPACSADRPSQSTCCKLRSSRQNPSCCPSPDQPPETRPSAPRPPSSA